MIKCDKGNIEVDGSIIQIAIELEMIIGTIRKMLLKKWDSDSVDELMDDIWSKSKKSIDERFMDHFEQSGKSKKELADDLMDTLKKVFDECNSED